MATTSSKQKPGPATMASNKPSKAKTALKIFVGIVLILGASAGATLFYHQQMAAGSANAEPALAAPVPAPAPLFSALDPFTVTLNSDRDSRVLYVGITLRVADQYSRKMVEDYMPEVRDRVLTELSGQDPDTVQTPTGRAALSNSLNQVLQAPYLPHDTGPQITSVLFTAFVVQ